MKKISIGLLAIVITAASASAQVSYGVHGSFIGSDMDIKSDDAMSAGIGKIATTRPSFRAGLVANLPIGDQFALMPQLNYVSAGTKLDGTATVRVGNTTFKYDIKGNMRPSFVELPVNFVYSKSLANESRFFAGLGPVVSMGIGGKSKVTIKAPGDPEEIQESKIKFDGKADATDDNIHFKRVSFGANAIAGYQFPSGLFVQANYTYNFSNLSPDKGETFKGSYAGVGVGFMLGGK